MTIEHELSGHVGRVQVLGDLLSQRDASLLVVTVADYCQNDDCSAIEVDLSLVFKISRVAVGAISALSVMAGIHAKPLALIHSHGKVRAELEREGLLNAE